MDANELVAKLRDLGVRQEGDPVLRQECQPFDLPAERAEAFILWDELRRYVDLLQQIYPFSKGVGLAAPQIGTARAMSIVRPPDGSDDIALINPTVVWQSQEDDEKYEGCLSFFDVRVPVRRPLAIRLQLAAFGGRRTAHLFDRGISRLIFHEIDHLHGILVRDLVRPGARLVPLAEYAEGAQEWRY